MPSLGSPIRPSDTEKYIANTILYIDGDINKISDNIIKKLAIIEIPDNDKVMETQKFLKDKNPDIIVFIRIELSSGASGRAIELTRGGAEALHLGCR